MSKKKFELPTTKDVVTKKVTFRTPSVLNADKMKRRLKNGKMVKERNIYVVTGEIEFQKNELKRKDLK